MTEEPAPRFLASAAVPAPQGHWLQCTHPAWPAATAAVAFAGLAAGALALPALAQAPWWGWLLAILWSGIMALIAWAYWSLFRAASKPGNWLLRADDGGLFLKIRSYRNHRIADPEPDVLFLPRGAVAWLRARAELMYRHDGSRHQAKQRRRSLEIKLAEDAWLEPIGAQLRVERGLWAQHRRGRSRHGHYPVRVADGVVRVAWSGGGELVRPNLKRALAALAHWYPVEAPVEAEEALPATLGSAEQEARIVALVEAGETVEALKLTRKLHGVGTKEAKAFIDGLRGR